MAVFFSLLCKCYVYVQRYISTCFTYTYMKIMKSYMTVKRHDLLIWYLFFLFFLSPLTKLFRPEIQDIDGNSQCHGLSNEKTEDVDDEDEELEEEDDDSLTGKSQDETVSPTAEPRGAYEDEEDEEPTSLTMSFDHTRR